MIHRAKAYIAENYAHDIGRDDVAEAVFMNPSYFSRYFKTKTGANFYDYLCQYRIRQAILLLSEPIPVGVIIQQVGYSYAKSFYKYFKRYTGYTPTEYRKHVLHMYLPEKDEEEYDD